MRDALNPLGMRAGSVPGSSSRPRTRAQPEARSAWAYCRVSTTKDEQELSLEEQQRWARNWAADEGLSVTLFSERASAKTTLGRKVFLEMVSRLESVPAKERPRYLLITSLDRLSRDITDTLVAARMLNEMGVFLYVRDRGVVRSDSFADRAALVGQSLGGEAENEARSQRARASWQRRRREGKAMSNKVPYGIQLRSERDTPSHPSAQWVVRAFKWYAGGIGMHRISLRMRAGAPPHRVMSTRLGADGKPVVRERTPVWDCNRVRKLFGQRRYREVIVDAALFDRVQELIARRPRHSQVRKFEYPLSGAVRCATCGRHFHGHVTGGTRTKRLASGVRRTYAATRTRYYDCTVCNYRINAAVLERRFRDEVARLAANDAALENWLSGESQVEDREALEREADKLETDLNPRELERVRARCWELALGNPHLTTDLEAQFGRLAADAQRKRERLRELHSAMASRCDRRRTLQAARALLSRFWETFDAADYDAKRELVETLVAALGGLEADKKGLRWTKGISRRRVA